MTPPPTPPTVLARILAADPARPRITAYDDTDGPTAGERIELSARVLANWVAKAANLLQDELDVGPGSVVRLDLPPHWRTLYWAWATWSVGACVEVPGGDTGPADVVVTDDPDVAADAADDADVGDVVLVTLAALARAALVPVPPGVVDEAREVATHGDVFVPHEDPDPDDPGLRSGGTTTSLSELVPEAGAGGRVHVDTLDTVAFLRTALEVYAGDGSLVLTRGAPEPEVLAARLTTEAVTREA